MSRYRPHASSNAAYRRERRRTTGIAPAPGLRSQDPAKQYFNQPYHEHELRHLPFNMMPPPRNPVQVAHEEGRQHVNQATGTTLFHDNPIPVGEHIGKTLRQVPARDLLRYAHAYPSWTEWSTVVDYVNRHRPEIEARAQKEAP